MYRRTLLLYELAHEDPGGLGRFASYLIYQYSIVCLDPSAKYQWLKPESIQDGFEWSFRHLGSFGNFLGNILQKCGENNTEKRKKKNSDCRFDFRPAEREEIEKSEKLSSAPTGQGP